MEDGLFWRQEAVSSSLTIPTIFIVNAPIAQVVERWFVEPHIRVQVSVGVPFLAPVVKLEWPKPTKLVVARLLEVQILSGVPIFVRQV